jgi:hypothetical protein
MSNDDRYSMCQRQPRVLHVAAYFWYIRSVSDSSSSLQMPQTMPPDREVGGPGGLGVSPIDLTCLH